MFKKSKNKENLKTKNSTKKTKKSKARIEYEKQEKIKKKKLKRNLFILGIVGTILSTVGGFVLMILTAGGMFVAPEYLTAWQTKNYLRYNDPRMQLVAHGILAPNSYNLQPWLIELNENNSNEFNVYVNPEKLAAASDPKARETLISIGCFLEYVSVSAKQLGKDVEITLFPNGMLDEENLLSSLQNLPVAKVVISSGEMINTELYDQIFKPGTNRSSYKPDKITPNQINTLTNEIINPNIEINFIQNDDGINRIMNLIMQATKLEAQNPKVLEAYIKTTRFNEMEKNRFKFGLSLDSKPDNKLVLWFKQGISTLFPNLIDKNATKQEIINTSDSAKKTVPTLALISTNDTTRIGQINCGRAYARIVLKAGSMGLGVYPLSRVVEDLEDVTPIKQTFHQEFAPSGKVVHMLFVIGTPEKPAHQSMRQNAHEVVKLD